MKMLIILSPGMGILSSDLVARIAAEIATESGCSIENIVTHQWDTEHDVDLKTIPTDDVLEEVLQKSVAIVTELYNTCTDEQTFIAAVLCKIREGGSNAELLKSAITVLLEYSNPNRLFTKKFGLKKVIYNTLKTLKDYNLL